VPPPHDSDEVFVQVLNEQSDDWTSAQAKELLDKVDLLLNEVADDFDGKKCDYWTLFDEINRRLHRSEVVYAWKREPGPDYNPGLGIIEKQIGQKIAKVSIGLPSDNFSEMCAVIELIPFDD